MNDVSRSITPTVNWYAEIFDMWDRPIPLEPASLGTMTLRHCVVEALGGAYAGEENLKGDERVSRWSLAMRIKEIIPGQEIPLKSGEVELIKAVVNKRWPQTFICGQIYRLLDPGER